VALILPIAGCILYFAIGCLFIFLFLETATCLSTSLAAATSLVSL
jgi:hypothetical protein